MNKLISLFLLLFVQQLIFAQSFQDISGAKSAGMGNTSVMYSDLWSVSNNQAGLAFLEKPVAGIYYENLGMIKETGFQSIAMAVPMKKSGTFGINVSYLGVSKYNESKVALAYGKKLSNNFAVGLRVNLLNVSSTPEYGTKSMAVAEIGMLAEPKEHLFIGAHLYNITRAMLVKDDNSTDNIDLKVALPTVLKIGLGYKFSDNVLFGTEVEKDLENKPTFKAGLDYQVVPNFYLRGGLSTNPSSNTFGIGYKSENINIDFAFSTHQTLGMSPHISINYIFE